MTNILNNTCDRDMGKINAQSLEHRKLFEITLRRYLVKNFSSTWSNNLPLNPSPPNRSLCLFLNSDFCLIF